RKACRNTVEVRSLEQGGHDAALLFVERDRAIDGAPGEIEAQVGRELADRPVPAFGAKTQASFMQVGGQEGAALQAPARVAVGYRLCQVQRVDRHGLHVNADRQLTEGAAGGLLLSLVGGWRTLDVDARGRQELDPHATLEERGEGPAEARVLDD